MAAGATNPNGDGRIPYEGERTVGELFAAASAELSSLVHDEISLAKAEIKEDVSRAGKAVVGGVLAAVVLLASLPMFSFGFAYGLQALGITAGWSFTIIGGAYVVIALVLAGWIWYQAKKIRKPERTIAGAQATAQVLKNAKPRPATKEEIDRALGRIQ
ncbi:phage holin family protein [Kitasatospora sp. NPDC092948]|uniref:phage holin family protein n=1 Tax=Kitasatospora sp. NPDC092948 TaxID=3364088 RepID=UPI003828CE60